MKIFFKNFKHAVYVTEDTYKYAHQLDLIGLKFWGIIVSDFSPSFIKPNTTEIAKGSLQHSFALCSTEKSLSYNRLVYMIPINVFKLLLYICYP